MPTPYWPLLTASGTPNERSDTCAKLPPISSSVAQPLSQPSPCRIVSTVRCVVPERDGAENADVAEVDRLLEIVPFLRRRQVVRAHVARVVHDAVAGRGEADVEAVRIVDRIGADLVGDALRLRLVLLQQRILLQHLEGVRRRRPHDVGRARSRLADEGDGRRACCGSEPRPWCRDASSRRPCANGAGQVLGERRDDDELVLERLRVRAAPRSAATAAASSATASELRCHGESSRSGVLRTVTAS